MIDFHTHVLPGIDDGSDSVDTSLGMLDMWRAQKIDCICATPHFYAEHNTPRRFIRNRNAAYEELLQAARYEKGCPKILLGAEVRFFDGISNVSTLDSLCLEGTNLLLLEMPFTRWTDRMLREVGEIRRRGIIPVAAHLERFMDFNSKSMIKHFMDMDILIQCNAGFFLNKRTSRKALSMLKDRRIHFIGSDAHNLSSRAPNMGDALQLILHKLGAGSIEYLLRMEELIDVDY